MRWISIMLILFCSIGMTSCTQNLQLEDLEKDQDFEETTINKKQEPIQIQLTAVGDIMVHNTQYYAQYNKHTHTYDFTNNFEFVKPYIEKSDFSICNLETTFGGKDRGYSSYPKFNTPDALAVAIKNTGFDMVVTSNNHTMDSGKAGVLRTIHVLKNNGLDVIGTKKNASEKPYKIKDIKGIRIGIMAYTYESGQVGGYSTLNGLKIPKDIKNGINTFNNDHLDEDLKRMDENIQKMKAEGAEVILFYLHWGNEYHRQPNLYQKKMAHFLAQKGVDIILGSHPHVIQPMEWIEGSNGKKTLVVYSMGNFLSDQRYENLKNRYTEDGVMFHILLLKNPNEEIEIKGVTYTPTWVFRYTKNKRRVYEILPLPDAIEDPHKYDLYKESILWRVKNSYKNTSEWLNTSIK